MGVIFNKNKKEDTSEDVIYIENSLPLYDPSVIKINPGIVVTFAVTAFPILPVLVSVVLDVIS